MKDILNLTAEIQKLRKNPILILDLKEVRKMDLLHTQKELYCKKFPVLDVILQTPGGDIDAAFEYSKLLRKCAREINIIVPLYAKSAGTLICLIADKILMTDLSELGPLDTQIKESNDGEFTSALNGFKALEQVQLHTMETLDMATKLILNRSAMKMAEAIHLATEFAGQTSGTLYSQLNPIKIGEYARALEVGESYGKIILTRYKNWTEQKAEIALKQLVYQYPHHGFVIDCEELQKIGFPAEFVNNETANLLFQLRELLIRTKSTFSELIEYGGEPTEINVSKETKIGNKKKK